MSLNFNALGDYIFAPIACSVAYGVVNSLPTVAKGVGISVFFSACMYCTVDTLSAMNRVLDKFSSVKGSFIYEKLLLSALEYSLDLSFFSYFSKLCLSSYNLKFLFGNNLSTLVDLSLSSSIALALSSTMLSALSIIYLRDHNFKICNYIAKELSDKLFSSKVDMDKNKQLQEELKKSLVGIYNEGYGELLTRNILYHLDSLTYTKYPILIFSEQGKSKSLDDQLVLNAVTALNKPNKNYVISPEGYAFVKLPSYINTSELVINLPSQEHAQHRVK